MYNDEISLISYEITKDNIGNNVKTPVITKALCRTRDIGNSEYYSAKVAGLKPSIKIIIHTIEYDNQKELMYRNDNYKVTRTYTTETDRFNNSKTIINSLKFDEIELTCEQV